VSENSLKITFINGEEVIRIKGGENFSDFEDFFSRVSDSVTGREYVCGR